jgi:hypothetical protein
MGRNGLGVTPRYPWQCNGYMKKCSSKQKFSGFLVSGFPGVTLRFECAQAVSGHQLSACQHSDRVTPDRWEGNSLGADRDSVRAAGEPTEGEIRACLRNMLAAAPFRDSPQLASFLSFVVDETLSGRGNDLKGYSIATLALGRPESFDPQTDPIVRVQAGRLRQAMAEYAAANPDEPVTIHLEKGAYAPLFSLREGHGSLEVPAAKFCRQIALPT